MNSKIEQLKQHLINANYQGHKLALPDQVDCWIEGGRIEPASKKTHSNSILAARFYYSAVISISPCYAPAELICAYVSFWLQNHGEREDSTDVEYSSDLLDDAASEVELLIKTFAEDIELVQTENGPFSLNGINYDFGPSSLWIAENFTLNAQVNHD